jgi:xanthine dehydrogenase accessory factor
VAVQRPTSARPGARGVIHPDGSIEGWVGGSCAQPIVIREALRSLADGQPRLLRLSRTPPSDSRRGDGIIEYIMACHSGGTLEIYVEPQLPSAALWVVGATPIAQALASLGSVMGHRVAVVDPVAEAAAFPGADRVVSEAGFESLASLESPAGDRQPSIVVATQGSWDEEALVAALALDATYVGLVASPTRAAAVRAWLRDEGVPEERVAALRAPAGLDLGAVTPEEIAVSILAELVQVRRGRAPFVAAPGPATLAGAEPTTAAVPAATGATHAAGASRADPAGEIVLLDPVCGMTVERDAARHLAEHGGVVYAFCSVGCRSRFVRDPGAYVAQAGTPDRAGTAGTIGA